MSTNSKRAAVDTAKKKAQDKGERIITLVSGVRAKICPVPASLIDEVTSKIRNPDVPMWYNPDRERDEPNPNDPKYLSDLVDANRKRGIAAIDAMALFGVDLIDGLPDDEHWLTKLLFMQKRGMIDLSDYDLDDPFDKEFVFKRFVAVDVNVLREISNISGITQEEIEAAEDTFPGQ